jgi:hypothetical protein
MILLNPLNDYFEDINILKSAVEAIIFTSGEPISLKGFTKFLI